MNKKVENKKVEKKVVSFASDENVKNIIETLTSATGNKFASETCSDGVRVYQINEKNERYNIGAFQTECYVRPRSIEFWVGYGALKRDTKETPIKSNTVKRALKCSSIAEFKTLCDKVATEKKNAEKATEKATEKKTTTKRKPATEKKATTQNKVVNK